MYRDPTSAKGFGGGLLTSAANRASRNWRCVSTHVQVGSHLCLRVCHRGTRVCERRMVVGTRSLTPIGMVRRGALWEKQIIAVKTKIPEIAA